MICDQDTHYTTPKHPEKGATYTNSLLSRSSYLWSPPKPPTDFSPIQFKTAARHRCTEAGSCVPTIQGRGCPGPSIRLSPPPSIASISLRCDCSAGSTKVRTVPGLLARAVLQKLNLSLRICLPQHASPSPQTLCHPLPARPMNVGFGGWWEVKVEHSSDVVEVYAPSHACLRVGGSVERSPHQLASKET